MFCDGKHSVLSYLRPPKLILLRFEKLSVKFGVLKREVAEICYEDSLINYLLFDFGLSLFLTNYYFNDIVDVWSVANH